MVDELEHELSEENEAMADLLIEAIKDPIDRLYKIPAWLAPSLECALSRVGKNDGSKTNSNEDLTMSNLQRVIERDDSSSSSFHTDLETFLDDFRPQSRTPEEEFDTDFSTAPRWLQIQEFNPFAKRLEDEKPNLNRLRNIVDESPACFGPAPWSTADSILGIIELSISSRGNTQLGKLLDDILMFVQRTIMHDERSIDFRILAQIGTELGIHHHWTLAEQLLRESLRIAKGTLRQPTRDMMEIMSDLANALSGSKQFDEAECLYRQSLALCEHDPQTRERGSRVVISNLARLLIRGRGYPPSEVVAIFKPICEVYLDGRAPEWRR